MIDFDRGEGGSDVSVDNQQGSPPWLPKETLQRRGATVTLLSFDRYNFC